MAQGSDPHMCRASAWVAGAAGDSPRVWGLLGGLVGRQHSLCQPSSGCSSGAVATLAPPPLAAHFCFSAFL